jgi:N-acetylornithine carbamoyltransferase
VKCFLDLADLSDDRLEAVLTLAGRLERNPRGSTLSGRTVGLVFMNPSLRTLASMEAGVAHLGGTSFVIQPGAGSWKLETRAGVVMDGDAVEHVREAIPVLAQYADALGVRCFAEGKSLPEDLNDRVIRSMAALSPVPFINLESAVSHPCQALADWKTLDDLEIPRSGGRFVLSWAWHPKPLPYAVPASALNMAARRGMEVTILRPAGYELPGAIMERARAEAARSGGSVRETADRDEAMAGAHVLYAKSWAAPEFYGRPEGEVALRARYREWCVAEEWFRGATREARFMHCLPVRRNVKVADHVLDGPRSVVVRQAGNRLHAQKALLVEMLTRGEEVKS